jgi:hypothetical protein
MANKYCNLDGTKKISEDFPNITTGFDGVATDVVNLQDQISANENDIEGKLLSHQNSSSAHNAEFIDFTPGTSGMTATKAGPAIRELKSRVEQIITTPVSGAAATQEVVDARNSTTKGVGYGSVDARLEAIEGDVEDTKKPEYSTPADSTATVTSLPSSAMSGLLNTVVKGNTAINLLTNGNFANGIADWTVMSASTSVSNNACTFTATGQYGQIVHSIQTIAGHKYYATATITADSTGSIGFAINDGSWFIVSDITLPVTNKKVSAIGTSTTTSSASIQVNDQRTTGWTPIKVEKVMVIDLTALGLDTLTVDQCNTRWLNWFDGIKSTGDFRIKATGKNLFDKRRSLSDGIINTSTGAVDYNAFFKTTEYIRVNQNTHYVKNDNCRAGCYDSMKNFLCGFDGYYTFTTPSNCCYIRSSIPNSEALDTLQIELGSTATAYEPYTESVDYLPEVGKSVPNGVCDQIDLQKGIKTQDVSNWVTISGNWWWSCYSPWTGGKNLATPYSGGVDASEQVIDYKGYPYHHSSNSEAYGSYLHVPSGNLYLNVPNTETGWTDAMTPSVSEIQAYFHGWKMCNSDGTSPYNDSGTKYWKKLTDGTGLTSTLPTSTYSDFTPYKMIYQLAASIITELNVIAPLQARPNGNIIIEPIIKFLARPVNGVITILDTSKPIQSIESVNKITMVNGMEVYTPITPASNTTTTITLPAGYDDKCEYRVVYFYSSELITLPSISYSFPLNVKGQVEGNTESISMLGKSISDLDALTTALLINIEARLTAHGM